MEKDTVYSKSDPIVDKISDDLNHFSRCLADTKSESPIQLVSGKYPVNIRECQRLSGDILSMK